MNKQQIKTSTGSGTSNELIPPNHSVATQGQQLHPQSHLQPQSETEPRLQPQPLSRSQSQPTQQSQYQSPPQKPARSTWKNWRSWSLVLWFTLALLGLHRYDRALMQSPLQAYNQHLVEQALWFASLDRIAAGMIERLQSGEAPDDVLLSSVSLCSELNVDKCVDSVVLKNQGLTVESRKSILLEQNSKEVLAQKGGMFGNTYSGGEWEVQFLRFTNQEAAIRGEAHQGQGQHSTTQSAPWLELGMLVIAIMGFLARLFIAPKE